jgi:hypothetical protein
MNVEEAQSLLERITPGSKVEHVKDQPGDGVVVFRIETPFFCFQIDQQIAIFAYFKEEENLLQFSDRGLYSFCVEDRSTLNLRRHRNFIRASGHQLLGEETSEDNSFVVNSPTIELKNPESDLPTLFGHYVSLLLYCGEV